MTDHLKPPKPIEEDQRCYTVMVPVHREPERPPMKVLVTWLPEEVKPPMKVLVHLSEVNPPNKVPVRTRTRTQTTIAARVPRKKRT